MRFTALTVKSSVCGSAEHRYLVTTDDFDDNAWNVKEKGTCQSLRCNIIKHCSISQQTSE